MFPQGDGGEGNGDGLLPGEWADQQGDWHKAPRESAKIVLSIVFQLNKSNNGSIPNLFVRLKSVDNHLFFTMTD